MLAPLPCITDERAPCCSRLRHGLMRPSSQLPTTRPSVGIVVPRGMGQGSRQQPGMAKPAVVAVSYVKVSRCCPPPLPRHRPVCSRRLEPNGRRLARHVDERALLQAHIIWMLSPLCRFILVAAASWRPTARNYASVLSTRIGYSLYPQLAYFTVNEAMRTFANILSM
jgi:hypothetical protein